MWFWISIALNILLAICLVVSVYLGIRFGRMIVNVEDQIEDSLDILDDCYRQIDVVAETPLLSDEPMIKQVVNSIRNARNAVLLVANKLVRFTEEDETGKEWHGTEDSQEENNTT